MFQSNGSIASGSYIWFGVYAEYYWYPRFDYGAKCYKDSWDEYESIPGTYPLYDANNYYDLKLSMYFTYTSAPVSVNYSRTITQSVKTSETKTARLDYARTLIFGAGNASALQKAQGFVRSLQHESALTDSAGYSGVWHRVLHSFSHSVDFTAHIMTVLPFLEFL